MIVSEAIEGQIAQQHIRRLALQARMSSPLKVLWKGRACKNGPLARELVLSTLK